MKVEKKTVPFVPHLIEKDLPLNEVPYQKGQFLVKINENGSMSLFVDGDTNIDGSFNRHFLESQGGVGQFANAEKTQEIFNDYGKNKAFGIYSHTAGYNNINYSNYSAILNGQNNLIKDNHNYVIMGGNELTSSNSNQIIFGKYNNSFAEDLLEIGNGNIQAAEPSNAFRLTNTGAGYFQSTIGTQEQGYAITCVRDTSPDIYWPPELNGLFVVEQKNTITIGDKTILCIKPASQKTNKILGVIYNTPAFLDGMIGEEQERVCKVVVLGDVILQLQEGESLGIIGKNKYAPSKNGKAKIADDQDKIKFLIIGYKNNQPIIRLIQNNQNLNSEDEENEPIIEIGYTDIFIPPQDIIYKEPDIMYTDYLNKEIFLIDEE